MKIAVIGSSHVASWVNGLRKLRNGGSPRHDLTFFASPRRGVLGFEGRGTSLIPSNEKLQQDILSSSNGLGYIDTKEFDALLVVGLFPFEVLDQDREHFSQDFFDHFAVDHAMRRGAHELLGKIREVTDKRVFLAHDPLISDTVPTPHWLRCDYSDLVGLLNRELFSPKNALLLTQLPPTISKGCRTKARFSVGSLKLNSERLKRPQNEPHPQGETKHMNADFGALHAKAFLDILDDLGGSMGVMEAY